MGGDAGRLFARETRRVELAAIQAVMRAEAQLGFVPTDVGARKLGYDVESRVPDTGKLRFIEVKGRIRGATSVTITKNEILTAFNKPDDWILALVEVPPSTDFAEGDTYRVREQQAAYNADEPRVRYVRRPFTREPDFGATSVNYNLRELWARGEDV